MSQQTIDADSAAKIRAYVWFGFIRRLVCRNFLSVDFKYAKRESLLLKVKKVSTFVKI
jgi:hypothetical protein